ncbi:squalene synthase HpnC [Phaeovibrio sulfidiphilus]|uniref:Squalene synthase HpnC n=1 Tax=Phaeovibrio sulfidiphilus TaxID=1220600 RepID=A0A8J6YNM8_9PROT|nr:squalene synthase HpnC [Phaeovibrio sulfidiphilus]MBE1236686.1 squalene synthase HpnC [Phaeovibrio sulfidiphilus]
MQDAHLSRDDDNNHTTALPVSPTVEAPSGKSAKTENFPVGSVLIARHLRPHVEHFYAFARAIDDIADAPELEPEEKIRRLKGFEDTLEGRIPDSPAYGKATALRKSLQETDVPTRHGVDLIAAFVQDAVKTRYDSWDDLMGYCALSAAPVGRYLIDLHGGARTGTTWASDALCAALQVINHLQDCGDDYREIDRVYLPMDWMEQEGARVEDLGGTALTPALRRVLDRCIAGTWDLLDTAACLSADIRDPRLSMEAGVIVEIARALTRKLASEDPLARRVKLTRPELALTALKGVATGLLARYTVAQSDLAARMRDPFANLPKQETGS